MGKTKLTMYFLVEGETERWYLQWLAEQVTAASPLYWADFRIGTRVRPDSFVRRMHPPAKEPVYVLLDYESTDAAHEAKFRSTLREMRQCADRTGVDFRLGYANYSFELWLILHRMDFMKPAAHRKDYLRAINQAFGTSFRSMPNYKKEKNFRRLLRMLTLEDVFRAMERAEQIRARCERLDCTLLSFQGYRYYRHDPSLSVDRIVADVFRRAGVPMPT